MSEEDKTIEEMARATSDGDLEAVRRILARKPNLSRCLEGHGLSGMDKDFRILKMLLDAGADINDCDSGESLLHGLVDVIADYRGSRYGEETDCSEVGRMIELGADPTLRDKNGRNLLDIAEHWGERVSLDAYLRSLGIRLE